MKAHFAPSQEEEKPPKDPEPNSFLWPFESYKKKARPASPPVGNSSLWVLSEVFEGGSYKTQSCLRGEFPLGGRREVNTHLIKLEAVPWLTLEKGPNPAAP